MENFESQLSLLIGLNHAQCANCGEEAIPAEGKHITAVGWKGERPGCGITWKYVTSKYQGYEKVVASQHPNLIYVSHKDVWCRRFEILGNMNNSNEFKKGG